MQKFTINMSSRGRITIPKELRQQIPEKYFMYELINKKLILRPLTKKEKFFHELDISEKEWRQKGGYSLKEVMKKSHMLKY